ncbi:MAG: type II toxin-antitoxin system VapC family toxin [Prevotella sp.]|nr:type II toxin-antitoxin system VapC family toxin [Prevotella sp.]
MSGKTYILDTNVIIYLSQEKMRLTDFSSKGDRLCISIISYMEALGNPFNNKIEETIVKSLCDTCEVFNLTKQIIDKTIEIRKQAKIKLPDAIIAASTLVNNAILVTANVKDFKMIDGISIINPIPFQ